MLFQIFFIFVLAGCIHAYPPTNQGWPPCADPTFTSAGVLDARAISTTVLITFPLHRSHQATMTLVDQDTSQ